MPNFQRRRWVWWAWTLSPWLLVFALVPVAGAIGGQPSSTWWSLDVCQHASLASPLLAWWRARRALRGAEPPREGRWLLTSPTPLWALGWAGCSALTMILGFGLAATVPYVGILALGAFEILRLPMNIWWLLRCAQDADRFAVLEVDKESPSGEPLRFVLLHARGKRRTVLLTKVDDFTREVGVRGDDEEKVQVWKAVGPVEDLIHLRRAGRAAQHGADEARSTAREAT